MKSFVIFFALICFATSVYADGDKFYEFSVSSVTAELNGGKVKIPTVGFIFGKYISDIASFDIAIHKGLTDKSDSDSGYVYDGYGYVPYHQGTDTSLDYVVSAGLTANIPLSPDVKLIQGISLSTLKYSSIGQVYLGYPYYGSVGTNINASGAGVDYVAAIEFKVSKDTRFSVEYRKFHDVTADLTVENIHFGDIGDVESSSIGVSVRTVY